MHFRGKALSNQKNVTTSRGKSTRTDHYHLHDRRIHMFCIVISCTVVCVAFHCLSLRINRDLKIINKHFVPSQCLNSLLGRSHEDKRVWLFIWGGGCWRRAADALPHLLVRFSQFSFGVEPPKGLCISESQLACKWWHVNVYIFWLPFRLPLSMVECSQFLGICALPGKVLLYLSYTCMLLFLLDCNVVQTKICFLI